MKSHDARAAHISQRISEESGFSIEKGPSGHFDLKIWGRFPPTWIGSLSSGLSRNRISVISGSAKKEKAVWQAEFEIMATPQAPDPNRIDYLALALERPASRLPVTISLDEFVIDNEPGKHDGALYLEVKAADQIGFLGALLNRLAYYTLFPESLIIETVNNRIIDRFRIKGLGGQFPSDASIKTLRQKLESFLVEKPGKKSIPPS
jgi:hypothetical protein